MLRSVRSLGRYELLAPLARGGMAEVYIARRRVGGVEKRLVVKRLRRERLGDARSLDLFIREAQLSMALVQQNIVPVFDFGRVGDDVFIAMELIDGADLATSLAHTPDGPLAPAIVAHVGAECCQALAHAHRAGVVHRDVSARNVLLSRDGEVKLADFGLAVAHGDAAVVGTPRYLAPEQARGEPVDGRADLYALGMVLLEAVTGAAARPGRSVEEVLAAARSGARAELPTTLPPALAEVLRRATATAAAERFADATSMWEALDAFLVADRTRGGDAPRRQLAAWLARCALPAPAGEQRDDAWITDQARSGDPAFARRDGGQSAARGARRRGGGPARRAATCGRGAAVRRRRRGPGSTALALARRAGGRAERDGGGRAAWPLAPGWQRRKRASRDDGSDDVNGRADARRPARRDRAARGPRRRGPAPRRAPARRADARRGATGPRPRGCRAAAPDARARCAPGPGRRGAPDDEVGHAGGAPVGHDLRRRRAGRGEPRPAAAQRRRAPGPLQQPPARRDARHRGRGTSDGRAAPRRDSGGAGAMTQLPVTCGGLLRPYFSIL
jgi:tRNA A-37 threonylcarbamoyl transferase component Bud32